MKRRSQPSVSGVRHRLFPVERIFLVVMLLALPAVAFALPATWIIPSNSEVWTAGTTHTIVWANGSSNTVQGLAYWPVSYTGQAVSIAAFFTNTGYASWTIPDNLPPGTYKLSMGFDGGEYTESTVFTIQPHPECLVDCSLVAASYPAANPYISTPPTVACGATANEAYDAAVAYVQAQLGAACFAGYEVNPASVVIDVTFLPYGNCEGATGGVYYAEASGLACCCLQEVPTTPSSWGSLKSQYR